MLKSSKSNLFAANQYYEHKISKYAKSIKQTNLEYYPIIFENFGGIHKKSKLILDKIAFCISMKKDKNLICIIL